MTPDATDDGDETLDANAGQTRYAQLTVGDDEYVIYDRENHKAWIQSTEVLDVGDRR